MKHFLVTKVLELQYLFLVSAFLYKRAAPDLERPFVNTPTICIHFAHKRVGRTVTIFQNQNQIVLSNGSSFFLIKEF